MNMTLAIQYRSFGGPEVLALEETTTQTVGNREVLVKVHAVGLNPIDYKIFTGDSTIRMLERLHRIQHLNDWFSSPSQIFPRGVARDFSGTVLALGKEITEFSVGERVFGTLRSAPGLGSPKGALATELVASAEDIASIPTRVDFISAATLGVAAQTAWGAFRTLDLQPTDILGISAASGGIGSLATQLAVSRGIKVVGIAGDSSQSYLQGLGATALSYSSGRELLIEEIRNEGVTKFLDCYGGDYPRIAMRAGISARHIGTLVPNPLLLARGVKFTGSRHGVPGDLATAVTLINEGKIGVNVEQIFPFTADSVRDAYRVLNEGHVSGKLVVQMNADC